MSALISNDTALPALRVGGDQLRRSLRRVTAGWLFGSVWMVSVDGATILNCGFLAGFTDFQWGLLTALTFIATLTQLPASRLVESTGRRKTQFMWVGVISRLMWMLVGLGPLVLLWAPATARPIVAWGILLVIFSSRLLEHMAVPAWMSWMADLIPRRLRGAYFARRTVYCIISQLAASVGLGLLFDSIITVDQRLALAESRLFARDLPHLVFTLSLVFFLASLFGAADILAFSRIREIYPRKPLKRIALKDVVLTPLRDRSFVCFSGSLASFTFGVGLSAPFFALLCQKFFDMSYLGMMIILTVCGPVGVMVSSRFWGKVLDRWGGKFVLCVTLVGAVIAAWGWLIVPRSMGWLGGVWSVFGGLVWGGIAIAKTSIELGFTDREAGSSYVAANNAIMAAAGAVGGLIGGILAKLLAGWHWQFMGLEFINYHVILLLSGLVRLTSVFWLVAMPSDGRRPIGLRVRGLVSARYNFSPALLFAPLRMLGFRARFARRPRDADFHRKSVEEAGTGQMDPKQD